MAQLDVRPELLRPIARHASAYGEDSQAGLLQQSLGEVVKIEEWVEQDLRAAFFGALAVVQREIESFQSRLQRVINALRGLRQQLQDFGSLQFTSCA